MRTNYWAGFLMALIFGLSGGNANGQTPASEKGVPLSHGILISSYTSGGIAGFNDTVQVSGNWQLIVTGRGKNWIRPLSKEEKKQIRDLLQHFKTLNKSHSDGPDIADGMFTSLVARGSGVGEAQEKHVEALEVLLGKLIETKATSN